MCVRDHDYRDDYHGYHDYHDYHDDYHNVDLTYVSMYVRGGGGPRMYVP